MKWFVGPAFCAMLFLISGAAFADTFDSVTPYVTVGVGTFHAGQISIDDVTGRVGARFGSYFGVEGEASFGFGQDRFIYTPPCAGPVCPQFLALLKAKLDNAEAGYVVGFLPLAPNADLFVRAGYGSAQFTTAGAFGHGFDQQGVKLGIGAQYFIDGQNGLRFDYTHTEFEGAGFVGREALGGSAADWSIAFTRRF